MADVLSRAFYDDPPMVWMLPDHQPGPHRRPAHPSRNAVTKMPHRQPAFSDGYFVAVTAWMMPAYRRCHCGERSPAAVSR